MPFPTCKIEIYDNATPTPNLVYTITSDAWDVYVREILTSGIGTFSFILPGLVGASKVYDDIGDFYKVKIYLGYGTLGAGDLQCVGRTLTGTTFFGDDGCTRLFEGKNQGEILERRLKTNRRYQDLDASTIVAVDIATELGIYDAAKIETDETDVTVTVRTEQYLDYLRKVSDYYDSGGSVQKDFWVDNDNKLNWRGRANARTEGVETLTVGENILDYRYSHTIVPSKNRITVYGAPSAYYPNNKDVFTDALDGILNGEDWQYNELGHGTLYLNAGTAQYGTYAIHCQNAALNDSCTFELELPHSVNLRDINTLSFMHMVTAGVTAFTSFKILLEAPDNTNYFQLKDSLTLPNLTWVGENLSLGDNNIYDSIENPNGIWEKHINANWWDIRKIRFIAPYTGGSEVNTANLHIDKLYFSPDRWVAVAENPTNQGIYDLREAEFTDDNLLSNSECQKRAQTLLYQLDDKVIALEVTTPLNTNIKIGDRIPMTLPAENNVSDLDFDVVAVEHHYTKQPLGGQTKASMIYGGNIRWLPSKTQLDLVKRNIEHLRAVTSELYSRVVR
jgi:hypothetical protein